MRRVLVIAIAAVVSTLFSGGASAQGGSQTITIKPGWNAVFLELQPEPNECATVFTSAPFAATDIKRVAMWVGDEQGAQFITDPSTLVPTSPGWLLYYPNTEFSTIPALKVLQGGRGYLIYSGAATNKTWNITGTPGPKAIRWKADAYNFTGFYVGQGTAPTFNAFFGPSPAHTGQPVYRMTTGAVSGSIKEGVWQKVASPSTDTLAKGEAYWIYTKGASQYQGPLRVTLSQGGILDFGKSTTEITMNVQYESNADPSVAGNAITCTITPQQVTSYLVPLTYWNPNVAAGSFVFTSLTAGNLSFPLVPQEEKSIRFAINRAGLPTGGGYPAGTRFESLLRIVGSGTPLGAGTVSYDVPVFAQSVAQLRAGLWAGDAVINAVSEHVGTVPRTAPTAVGREFSYRILIHVDDAGNAKLLQKAVLLWKSPSEPVVLATDSLIKTYQQALAGQSEPIGRRLTAPAFGFDTPLAAASGTFPALNATSNLAYHIVLPYTDPLNPFLHRYHPDHDNLQSNFTTVQAEGVETYTVTRDITLHFKTEDPEGRSVAGWGDTELGGTIDESIAGLMRDTRGVTGNTAEDNTIKSSGYFRLHRISDVGQLDPAY